MNEPVPGNDCCGLPEHWRPVVGLGGRYDISDHGRCWSRLTHRGQTGRLLVPCINGTGRYMAVMLTLPSGRQISRVVHGLVMSAFVGPRPPGQEVLHGLAGRLDNHLSNLRYGTRAENERDKVLLGGGNAGENNGQALLTRAAVFQIRYLLKLGAQHKLLARCFEVNPSTISDVAHRRTWRSV